MKWIYFLLVTGMFFGCKYEPPRTSPKIKIVLDTEEPLRDADTIYLTGNTPILGNWQAKGLSMTRRSESRWEKTFSLNDTGILEFKFTLGSFEREAVSNKGLIPDNTKIDVKRDTEIYFILEQWKELASPVSVHNGSVETHLIKPFNGLSERPVTVWLPEGYHLDKNKKYPTLYVHDGQNQFDSSLTMNHQEWGLDETLTRLSLTGQIQVPLVIAINNTAQRNEEYGSVTKQSLYADFICEQLKPFIDSHYRTKSDRINTATMGSSLGGLIAFNLSWYRNNIFSKAACLSPALKIEEYDFPAQIIKDTLSKRNLSLYFDNGTRGIDEKLQNGLDETMKLLNKKGYTFTYFAALGDDHTEAAWAKRVEKPLIQFFGQKKQHADRSTK